MRNPNGIPLQKPTAFHLLYLSRRESSMKSISVFLRRMPVFHYFGASGRSGDQGETLAAFNSKRNILLPRPPAAATGDSKPAGKLGGHDDRGRFLPAGFVPAAAFHAFLTFRFMFRNGCRSRRHDLFSGRRPALSAGTLRTAGPGNPGIRTDGAHAGVLPLRAGRSRAGKDR